MADSGLFGWCNDLAILGAGVRPSWVRQTSTFADPPAPNDAALGVDVLQALLCHIRLRTRENPLYRTCRVSISAFVGSGPYTFTVGATPYATGAGPFADAEALFTAVVTALAPASATVTASVEGTGTSATLKVQTVASGDVAFAFAGGTDTFVITADCVSAVVQYYSMASGTDSTSEIQSYWDLVTGATATVTITGYSGPILDVSGCKGLYAGATCTGFAGDGGTVVATARLWFGPCTSTTPGFV